MFFLQDLKNNFLTCLYSIIMAIQITISLLKTTFITLLTTFQ